MGAYEDKSTGSWWNAPPEFGGQSFNTKEEAASSKGPGSSTVNYGTGNNNNTKPPSGGGGGGSGGGGGLDLNSLSGLMGQFSAPYEKLLRDMLAAPSMYQPRSEEERKKAAESKAELQLSPLLSAIQSRRSSAGANYDTGKTDIETAYAGVPGKIQASLEEARRYSQENAIARGMGRSGVVDWTTQKLSAPLLEQQAQAEREKAGKLSGLSNSHNALLSDLARQEGQVSGQRGSLIDSIMDSLYREDMGLGLQSEASKYGQAYNLANLANQSNLGQQSLMTSLLPMLLYG